jgi:Putative Ig domain
VAGSTYAFQPAASDPSGLTLGFSVQNKPAWATFSIASGLLNGTPNSTQTGTYANITISASDGQHSSALPAFSIVVSAPAPTGTALIALTPPTQNTNGSALTDLAGFRIYYGTSPSSLTQLVQLAGTSTMSYTVNSLASGTWYFAATAYSSAGMQSAMSTPVSKTIP